MGAQGLSRRLVDIFKAMVEKLTQEGEVMVLVLPGSKDFSTNILHHQHAVHQLWNSSVHMQCPRIDGGLLLGVRRCCYPVQC